MAVPALRGVWRAVNAAVWAATFQPVHREWGCQYAEENHARGFRVSAESRCLLRLGRQHRRWTQTPGRAVALSERGSQSALRAGLSSAGHDRYQQTGVAFTTFSVRDPHEAIRGTGTIRFKSGEGQSADLRYTLRRNGTARRYRLIIVGEALYLMPPAGTRLPHGKSWLRGTAGGSDAVSKAMLPLMSEVTQLDPTSDFGALKDVPALNVVGKERIGGTATTHYATHLDLPLLGDVFGPGAGRGARYELWIDDQGLPGKYRVSTKIPHLGVMRFAGIFTNWGTSITVKTPAPADVYTAH